MDRRELFNCSLGLCVHIELTDMSASSSSRIIDRNLFIFRLSWFKASVLAPSMLKKSYLWA